MKRAFLFLFVAAGCGGSVVSTGDASSSSGQDAATTGADSGTTTTMPSKGIACGTTTCTAGSEQCCVKSMTTSSCVSSTAGDCSGQVFRVGCDDKEDCPGRACCFTNVLSSAQGATLCNDGCTGFGMFQVCKTASECPNGTPCNAYTCGGSFGMGSIKIGLCAATAPMFCQ